MTIQSATQNTVTWPPQDPDRKHEALTDAERLQHFRVVREQIRARLEVLAALRDVPDGPDPCEFHASIRVPDLHNLYQPISQKKRPHQTLQ